MEGDDLVLPHPRSPDSDKPPDSDAPSSPMTLHPTCTGVVKIMLPWSSPVCSLCNPLGASAESRRSLRIAHTLSRTIHYQDLEASIRALLSQFSHRHESQAIPNSCLLYSSLKVDPIYVISSFIYELYIT